MSKNEQQEADKLASLDIEGRLEAVFNMSPTSSASFTINALHQNTMHRGSLVGLLEKSCGKVHQGDTTDIEDMLMSQAHTLNVFFNQCLSNTRDMHFADEMRTMADLGLRAQRQCAKTLKVLADLKHPKRTTFIQQQNNAINQQVNNTENQKKDKKPSNELYSEVNNGSLEQGSTTETIPINPSMETMEAVHRRQNRRR